MRSRHWQLGRMKRRRFVERNDPKRLQAARALHRFDDNSRAFIGSLKAVAPETGDVKKNVGQSAIGNYKPKPLGDVEPLDSPAHLDDVERLLGRLCRS
jgi:hypothetical protein